MYMEFMQLVGYSNADQKILESYAILYWIKYLRENIGSERCSKKGVYACLGIGGSSIVLHSAVVALQLLVLPKRKQYNKKQNK